MGHPAECESADPGGEAGDCGGGTAAGRDQGLSAGGAGKVASGGFAGGWEKSVAAWASYSGGDYTARGAHRHGTGLEREIAAKAGRFPKCHR